MKKAHVLLVVLVAAIIPLLVSLGEHNAAPEPPVSNSAGHYSLGDGRYLAVVPAAPVPAPLGTIGISNLSAIFTMETTCSVDKGLITTSGVPSINEVSLE